MDMDLFDFGVDYEVVGRHGDAVLFAAHGACGRFHSRACEAILAEPVVARKDHRRLDLGAEECRRGEGIKAGGA